MKKIYIFFYCLFALTTILFLIDNSHEVTAEAHSLSETLLPTAEVIEIVEERYEDNDHNGTRVEFQSARVRILEGIYEGEILLAVSEKIIPSGAGQGNDFWVKENDKIVVQISVYDGEIIRTEIMTHKRDFPAFILVALLLALLLYFGKWQGAKSVLTLGLTIFLIFNFMIPRLFEGYSPILLAMITGTIVTITTFLIISGVSKKSIAAMIGTIGGLASAAFVSILFSQLMRLTGYHSDQERVLISITHDVNFDLKGILLAGIIIGALGAIMDVAISIASSMEEVKKANPSITKGELLKSGMNVGKDIMGTMANTLILAYVGAGLPLLITLYGYGSTFSQVIHMEFLAVEILRTVAGSIGLILSIPVTALIACMLIKTRKSKLPRYRVR